MIELLMALALSSIIIAMIASFFINNSNHYNKIDNNIELQYQAQSISNFIEKELLEAKGLLDVVNEDGDSIIDHSGTNTFNKIVIDDNGDGIIFELINDNEICYRININDSVNKKLGKYIDEMEITSIPETETETTSYKDAQCINLKIAFKKDGQTYTSEQNIYFRNSK